ncbi:hypothetical protein [Chengkuizengella axinellae]|uniref:Uncharacterized protein n=1 Tax=Chengkuizengella axinellae TaxID=3064388 RepID=A0ABT9J1U1_9BACL|nr:hypothetical protein [Chengkuizengella sp. 2205SS18-9]MDP5275573.1 hypothetical protein [Chengkuizengella sp. 2205SS18-9]
MEIDGGGGPHDLTSSGSDPEILFYLESSYFEKTDALYFEFSSIRALDKNNLEFKVDLNSGNIKESSGEEYIIEIPKQQYTYPLTFTFTGFPSTINGDVRIKVRY